MHCVRRAALRAACSSSRVIAAPRQQVASIAMQMSKVGVSQVAAMPLSRYFSQTPAAAQDQFDEAPVEAEDNTLQPAAGKVTDMSSGIFISNMTYDATETHLEEAFSKYGEISACNIARDGRGLSRGFGFVTFKNAEAADRAIAEADNSFWHGRRINVSRRHQSTNSSGSQRSSVNNSVGPTSSLYIGNIPYEASDVDLNALFRELENVTDVRVAVDRNTGWPRGFAHADFADVASAEKAMKKLSVKQLGGRLLRVDYSTPRSGMPRGKSDKGENQNQQL